MLRNHLLALSYTEPQLETIKNRSVDIATTQDSTVVEVLQLWQKVFRETFQQYHRLSARLIKSSDVVASLSLWQEYLAHVQDFLANQIPGDYNGLTEHRNLCQVHKDLLVDQQKIIMTVKGEESRDLSIADKFNALTNLHNETLAKLMERHLAVQCRISAWDRYKQDQTKLLRWLKEIERERGRLDLRFIHLRMLDKVLSRIQALLDKVPAGEAQAKSLQLQQETLLIGCDEALAASIRMEHSANTQRLSNLQAGLSTWRDYVKRIIELNKQHVEQTQRVTATFQDIGETLSCAFHAAPTTITRTRRKLEELQLVKAKLLSTSSELDSLGITSEQLRECLSPTDMKSLNQQDCLLRQQHGDLEHQLALLMFRLEERCGLRSRWDSRVGRLLTWINDTVARIESCDLTCVDEPEEAIRRLESELDIEVSLKQREFEWVHNTGQELIDIAEGNERLAVEESLGEVNERWNYLLGASKARSGKLSDLTQTVGTLEKRIADIKSWLGNVEGQLLESFILESSARDSLDKKLEDHEVLQKTIETESGNVGEVLNLCEILLSDCDSWNASFNTDGIKAAMEGLERRWKTVCVKSASRKSKLVTTWGILQELERMQVEHKQWLSTTCEQVASLEKRLVNLNEQPKDKTDKTLEDAQRLMRDIDARDSALQMLEQKYSLLAKGGLDPDNLKSLTRQVRQTIDEWHSLVSRTNCAIVTLQTEQKAYREFVQAHGAVVIGLSQIDMRLTHFQHLSAPEQRWTPKRRQQELAEIERDLERQNPTLKAADELALSVMGNSSREDVDKIQEMVDEYQTLWKSIKSRMDALYGEIVDDEKREFEVDRAVQVETLKFEQDSAVQVDTLPRLIRMTSCDAYLMELVTAIEECRSALDSLETAVVVNPIPDSGLQATTKAIVSCYIYRQVYFEKLYIYFLLL